MGLTNPIQTLKAATKDLTWYFAYLLLIATTGPFLFGFHIAELNAPQSVITCARTTSSPRTTSILQLPQCIPMTPAQFGLASSIFTLGGLLGALAAGPAAARYGRLHSMRLTTFFFTLGPLAEALAPSIAVLSFGRFVSGLGAGASVVVVPIYISEVAPPAEKGFFGAFTQVSIGFGILLAQVLGYFMSRGQLWRVILGVGGIIGLGQLAGLFLAVESPKWLADNGKANLAKRELRRIRGHSVNVDREVAGWGIETSGEQEDEEDALLRAADDDDDNDERPEIRRTRSSRSMHSDADAPHPGPASATRQAAKAAERSTIGILRVVVHPEYYKSTVAVIGIMVAQQACGINSVMMYGVSVLADVLPTSSAAINVLVALVGPVVTLLCAPLPDKLGRKPCLLLSIAGMGVSALVLAVAIVNNVAALSGVMVLTFVSSFALGLGPIPFILSSELVGPEAVGATQSWALASNWIATFAIAQFFPMVNEKLGKGKVYFVFAAAALFFGLFTAWWVPETKGKRDAAEVWGKRDAREGRTD